ncbi:MAG: 2-oxoglutarate dehydrogenase, E2 component, dihydrolipoamide succinyltransferase [Acidobacteria bacterium]|nr:2-oxoglutarate dehydrogenase, E2 component, dihydrolipoamide succinyltransferase [Acidobacteriota bacterium]
MAVDVVMPQMGESIAEGTISRWIKKVGDKVTRDEPLLEISTDKVDAEIPAPSAGVLAEILAKEGETVAVNSVVARIAAEGEATAQAPSKAEPLATPAAAPVAAVPTQPAAPTPAAPVVAASAAEPTVEDRRREKSSPLVRKIAAENNVDISQIAGSGLSGRVTKNDILTYIEQPRTSAPAAPAPVAAASVPPPPAMTFAPGERFRVEPMSVMRKKIADHMVSSKRTSAHVSTVWELDFTEIDRLRRRNKESYAERGAKLTFLPFIVHAIMRGLRQFPVLNASIDGDNVVYHNEINIGIAVALDWGLIVPVLRNADEKNILGLARAINDLGERARGKKLNPSEVQGGTFTITNPGIYGGLYGLPIINQPQVAILGVGGVKKRPVVIETDDGDAIAIRSMCHLSLTFDHRLIDGAVADQFMAEITKTIEGGQFSL